MIELTSKHKPIIKLSGSAFDKPKRWVEKMFREIYLALIAKDKRFNALSKEEQQSKMSFVNVAYTLAKSIHRDQKRLDGTRYFNHIQGVTHILATEFPVITFNQIIAAYLHDIVEDSDITLATIENIFWQDIANIVDAVTKKPDAYYLRPDERQQYDQLWAASQKAFLKSKLASIKSRRTDHYFGHMKELDAEILQVKFADRIHNLRDLKTCRRKKIIEQIQETQMYLLPIALEKNPIAYKLMKIELEELHIQVYGHNI
jgi:GTP diphosphokinase / guanosine-3',5'-bis(diphosphate) 3'-diphosphatase